MYVREPFVFSGPVLVFQRLTKDSKQKRVRQEEIPVACRHEARAHPEEGPRLRKSTYLGVEWGEASMYVRLLVELSFE